MKMSTSFCISPWGQITMAANKRNMSRNALVSRILNEWLDAHLED